MPCTLPKVNDNLVNDDATVRPEGDEVAFVDGHGTFIRHQRKHAETHAVIGGEEAVAEQLLQFSVVVAGVLDPFHKRP